MAKYVHKDAVITLGGTALSDHANACTIEDGAEEVDATGFNPAGYREFIQGLKDASIQITFLQDYAAGSVDAVLSALYASGGTTAVVIKPTSATVSATNPTYTMVGRLFSYGPVAGALGDVATVEATFRHAGTLGVVRPTA
jgi:hypothetical protein